MSKNMKTDDGITLLGRHIVEGLGFAWKKYPEEKPQTKKEILEGLTFRFRFAAGHTLETLSVARNIFAKASSKADKAYFATGLCLGLPFKLAHDTVFASSFSRVHRKKEDSWGEIVSNNPSTYDVFPSRNK